MENKIEDMLWVIWNNPETNSRFKIGKLIKIEQKYYFKYNKKEIKKALEEDFSLFPAFPVLDVIYFKEELFNTFSKKLPTKNNKETNKLLKKSKLNKHNSFELLKNLSENDLENIEFVDDLNSPKSQVNNQEK